MIGEPDHLQGCSDKQKHCFWEASYPAPTLDPTSDSTQRDQNEAPTKRPGWEKKMSLDQRGSRSMSIPSIIDNILKSIVYLWIPLVIHGQCVSSSSCFQTTICYEIKANWHEMNLYVEILLISSAVQRYSTITRFWNQPTNKRLRRESSRTLWSFDQELVESGCISQVLSADVIHPNCKHQSWCSWPDL